MSIDAEWCRFTSGTTRCINGTACPNPNHREHEDDDMADFNRDRFGRALITLPGDDKPTPHTRATTLAKTLDDQYHLGMWKARMVAYALGQNRTLVDLAAGADSPDDKQILADVVEKAMNAAGSSDAASMGTALHKFTQRLDEGDASLVIPEHWRDHVTRYRTLIQAFRVVWAWIEVPLVLPDILVAGTADRVDTEGLVWDLKTGKDLSFAEVSIAQQLAIYARAKYRYEDGKCLPAPEMNQDEARVIWLPAKGDQAKVYRVDIATGWELAMKSYDIRNVRKTKNLFEEIQPSAEPLPSTPVEEEPAVVQTPAPSDPNPNRLDEVKARVIKIKDAGFVDDLAAKWAPDVPTLKEGGLSAEQLELVDSWCEAVERDNSLPF